MWPPASTPAAMAAALFLHPWRFCTSSAKEAEADLLALMDSHNESVAAGLGADGMLTRAQHERLRAAFGWKQPGVLFVFSVRHTLCAACGQCVGM